jgi:Na+-driven multidrug efflux pump
LPMRIMLAMNGLNIACSAAIIILAFVRNPSLPLNVRSWVRGRFDWSIVRMILGIGLPFGIENGMFYFGRIVVLSLVATFGTAAIAANAVAGIIGMFEVLPGMSIGLGLTVILGLYGLSTQATQWARELA